MNRAPTDPENMAEMKSLNIGILQGLLGNPNMGCNALFYSAIRLLQQAAELLDLGIRVTCFSNTSPSELDLYPLLRGTPFVSAVPYMTPRQIIADLVKGRGEKRKLMREAYESCDIFFEIAGGDSFSDIYGIERLTDANRVHRMVRRLKKPLVFLPQTIGPFATEQAAAIASDSLRHARFVFTRDPVSFSLASSMVEQDRIMQTIDMACFMDYIPAKSRVGGMIRAGVNPSGLLWNGGYTGRNQFGLAEDYKQTIRNVIRRLGDMQVQPVLVAHVLNGPGFQIEDDYRVCLELKSEFPLCDVAPYFYTPMEAKSFISGLDLLIGSRMHACIGAYTSGVPVFPLAYSRKFSGFFNGALEWNYGADLKDVRSDMILARLTDFCEQLSDLRFSMPLRLEKLGEFKEPLLAAIRALIEEAQI